MRFNDIPDSKRKDMLAVSPSAICVEDGWNRRTKFLGIEELALDMHRNGQKQPVIVRNTGETVYLVDGERRWRASRLIVEKLDPEFKLLAIPENHKATPLDRLFSQLAANSGHAFTYLEKARLYQSAYELGATQQEIADRAQLTKQAVSRALMLVEKGAPDLLSLVEQEKISAKTAGKIIDLHPDDHDAQVAEANKALDAAAADGKDHASGKHLPGKPPKLPALTFEFNRTVAAGACHPVNEHDVATDPDYCAVASPAAWKLSQWELNVARLAADNIWHHGFAVANGGSPCTTDQGHATEREAWLACWDEAAERQAYSLSNAAGTARFAAQLQLSGTRDLFIAALDAHLSGKGDTASTADAADTSGDVNSSASPEAKAPRFLRFIVTGAPDLSLDDGTVHEDNVLVLANPPAGITRLHLLSRDAPEGTAFGYRINDYERRPDLADFETLGEDIATGFDTVLGYAKLYANQVGGMEWLAVGNALDEAIGRYYPVNGDAEDPGEVKWEAAASSTGTDEPEAERSGPALTFKGFTLTGRPPEPAKNGDYQEQWRFVLQGMPTESKLDRCHLLLSPLHGDDTDQVALGWRYVFDGEETEILPNEFAHHLMEFHPRSVISAFVDALVEAGVEEEITGALYGAWDRVIEALTPEGDFGNMETLAWVAKADSSAVEKIKESGNTNRDGSSVGPGNNTGFVSCDKRLKELNTILENLDGKGDTGRITTANLIEGFLNNDISPSTLRNHLLGKA